ncbi:MAG: hypothetical protein AAFQ22_05005 [Pseudomonadota bacterium]
MIFLPKPYSAYVGRSTTPFRAVLALLAANFVAPLLVLLVMLVPGLFSPLDQPFSLSGFLPIFGGLVLAGAAIVAPFLWIGGGIIWMFAHGLRKNGPVAAGIAAFAVSVVGTLFWNASMILPGPLGSSFSANGVDIIVDGTLTLAGWMQIGVSILKVGLGAVLSALLIWIIAYKGRPVRPPRDMEAP